jgi:hypothetical protein
MHCSATFLAYAKNAFSQFHNLRLRWQRALHNPMSIPASSMVLLSSMKP